jgi:hypothetical protein
MSQEMPQYVPLRQFYCAVHAPDHETDTGKPKRPVKRLPPRAGPECLILEAATSGSSTTSKTVRTDNSHAVGENCP